MDSRQFIYDSDDVIEGRVPYPYPYSSGEETEYSNENNESTPILNKNNESTPILKNDNNIYDKYDPANDRVDDGFLYYTFYRCLFPFHDSRFSEPNKKCLNYSFIILLITLFVIGCSLIIVYFLKQRIENPITK